MKRCPTCNRTFDDEWLSFCTEDGTTLVETQSAQLPSEPPPTVWIPPALDTNPVGGQKPFDLPGSYNPPQPVAPIWHPPPPPPVPMVAGQKQGLAVASLVLGIFSITVGWCCSIGLLSAPVGIVLGIVSLVQIKNDPVRNTGKPLSIVGLVLSSVYVLFWFIIFMVYGMAIFMGSLNR
ncbi:MAG TPA: DUF4190 domain-containing protein [Pyrinomonadaceae bacterium]|jgi:uncharacterized protein DUF4190|nr:DUF4190 domain-containing protein [Pyrinomonadaceae bacterium]